jgi:hypothetical protein
MGDSILKTPLSFIKFFVLSLIMLSCATPGYVLHSKRAGGLFTSPEESAPISANDGVALLYDREPLVAFERRQQDGSVWLTYAIVLKNTSGAAIELDAQRLRLEGGGKSFSGVYSREDNVGDVETIDSGTYFRLTVNFKVSKEFIEKLANENESALLIAPIRKRGELKLPLWVWKV